MYCFSGAIGLLQYIRNKSQLKKLEDVSVIALFSSRKAEVKTSLSVLSFFICPILPRYPYFGVFISAAVVKFLVKTVKCHPMDKMSILSNYLVILDYLHLTL